MNKFYKIILFLVPLLFFVPNINIHAEELDQEQNNSFSGLYGYDFSEYGLWTQQGYEDSYFYNSDAYLPNGYQTPITETFVDTLDLSSYYQDYPYFVFTQDYSNRNTYYVYLFSEPTLFTIYGNHSVAIRGSGAWKQFACNNSSGSIVITSVDDYSGSQVQSSNYTHRFVFSNINVYSVTSNLSGDALLTASDYVNINYCIYDDNGELRYTNPITNGGGSSGEDASNNLFLKNPKWSFNNIPILDNVYSSDIQKNLGTISFTAELTDYQLQHLNEFSIQFNFDTYLKLRFVNNDGTQNFTNQTFNIHKTVSLTEFYNNGLTDSNLVSNIWDGWYSTGNGNLTLNNYLSSLNQSDMFNPVVFQTQCKATLIHNNDSSGNLTTAYNYLNGASQTSDSGLGINPNPYNNDYDGFFDDQFNNNDKGSNTTTNNGDGNIVNNNNPQITINNNNNNALTDDGDSNGLLTKILLLLANNQSASSEGLAEVADTTGYVEVLGATFTAVPSNWWTVLTASFIASIGIIVVSFVLKVILNFVT